MGEVVMAFLRSLSVLGVLLGALVLPAPALALLSKPSLSSPSNGATNQELDTKLSWSSVSGANKYRVFVADSQSTLSGLSDTTTSCYSCAVNTTTSSTYYNIPSGKLTGGTKYYWLIRAESSSDHSENSDIRYYTTKMETLSRPSLSSPSDGAKDQDLDLKLSWYSVSGAKTYTIFVAPDESTLNYLDDAATTCAKCALVTNSNYAYYTVPKGKLAGNTKYFWMVRAEAPGALSPFSYVRDFTTTFGTDLGKPSLSSPSDGATKQALDLKLSWYSVSGAKTYSVFVATTESTLTALDDFATTCAKCTLVASSNYTYYTVPKGKLAGNTKYFWMVRAEAPGQLGDYSSIRDFTTTYSSDLGKPSLSSPADGAVDQPINLTLSWSSVSGAKTYSIFLATSTTTLGNLDDFATSCSGCVHLGVSNTTSYKVPAGELEPGKKYFWMVRAEAPGVLGPYSNTRGFSTKPVDNCPSLAPAVLKSPTDAQTGLGTTPTLAWNAVAGATEYRVFLASSYQTLSQLGADAYACPGCVLNNPSATTSFVVPFGYLVEGQTYYWMVRAASQCGGGPSSIIWFFSTGAGGATDVVEADGCHGPRCPEIQGAADGRHSPGEDASSQDDLLDPGANGDGGFVLDQGGSGGGGGCSLAGTPGGVGGLLLGLVVLLRRRSKA
jgi:hypothetical protein